MDYEVELKYPLADPIPLREWLITHDARPSKECEQRDVYFNHPARDFAETDEAFRIRSVGDANRLTYKGSLVDKQTKTRQEIEVGCEQGAEGREKLREMLLALGFCEVRAVVKQRTPYYLEWQGRDVEVAIDVVEGLGTFVELETIAASDQWESARDALLQLAEEMGLQNSERRSYLQLLLEE